MIFYSNCSNLLFFSFRDTKFYLLYPKNYLLIFNINGIINLPKALFVKDTVIKEKKPYSLRLTEGVPPWCT